jgi:hypothetical protein
MSLTQQFHLLKRICHAVDTCCKSNSPQFHAPATAAALRHALKSVAESLLDQRLRGHVFSFEALHRLLDASMGTLLLLQRCCYAGQGFAEASTVHIFIKMAPILYLQIAAAAAMLHVSLPSFDRSVFQLDFFSQLMAIQMSASPDSAADAASSNRSQRLTDLISRVHKEPHIYVVPAELLNLSMVSS